MAPEQCSDPPPGAPDPFFTGSRRDVGWFCGRLPSRTVGIVRAAGKGAAGGPGCTLQPRPGHIDKAAGLKPVGDFFFYQALIAGIPAVFLAAWLIVIPLEGPRYEPWRRPYMSLLVLGIAFELFAFFVPMLWFHNEMTERKRGFYE